MHKKAQAVIEWLKNAESESDDDADEDNHNGHHNGNNEDEDDEDALEVVYDERTRPDKIVEIKEEPSKLAATKKALTAEDDLDIDAI